MGTVSPTIQQKIQQWREKLTGLRRNNSLLKFSPSSGKAIKLLMPASQVFKTFIDDASSFSFNDVETEPSAPQKAVILKKLRKAASDIQREKGVNSLFVAIGALAWKQRDEKTLTISPILLIPVELQKVKRRDEYVLTGIDEDVLLNPILAQKLNIDYGITLREIPSHEALNCNSLLEQVRQDVADFPDWKIESVVYLTLFERPKAAMLNDLEQYTEKIVGHPILRAFANDLSGCGLENCHLPDVGELNTQHPKYVFQVLDADSSQQIVIEAAKNNLSFIVQGPPGTGKSQTITNIIAELVAQRKRVLLVAEKPGALEVVAKRLRDCGLGDLCLTLYNRETSSKKGFSRSLQATAEHLEQFSSRQISESFFEELKDDQKILNRHVEQLHQIWSGIDKSAYDLYGALLELECKKVPSLKSAIQNIEQWTVTHLREAKQQLETLEQLESYFREQSTTLWSKSQRLLTSSQERAKLEAEVLNLRENIRRVVGIGSQVNLLLGLPQPNGLQDIGELESAISYVIERPSLLPHDWNTIAVEDLQFIFSNLIEKDNQRSSHLQALQDKYKRVLVELDIPQIIQQIRQNHKSILRVLTRGYWRTHRTIFNCRREQTCISFWISYLFGYKTLLADLHHVIEYLALSAELSSSTYSTFNLFQQQNRYDFEAIRTSLRWIDALGKYPLHKEKVAALATSRNSSTELVGLYNELRDAQLEVFAGIDFLSNCFPDTAQVITGSNQALDQVSLATIIHFLDEAERDLDTFGDWTRCQECIRNLQVMGLGTFVDSLKSSNITPDFWYPALQKAAYQRWLDHIYDKFPKLKDFSIKVHDRRVQEFSQRDRYQYSIAQKRACQLHARQWQSWLQLPGSHEKRQLLNTESKKQRQQKSIRQFIKETGDLVSVLKPCWLMSPQAASEYIDPQNLQFDSVIFDEASQIRTEEAVSAIMRAKQVIVVGDDQQLPPFSFASYVNDEDEDDNTQEDYESLLVECGKFMRSFTLRWHYRSYDESLITFSNKHFYDSKLITFPNPIKDSNRGVHFHYVQNGIYSRGSSKPVNLIEAAEVAQLALHHAQTSKLSLGIIAFSKNQADAIQKELDRLSTSNSELAELQEDTDKFLLRHLESVQGEERDVIILSFCYGRDQQGKMEHNFGPLIKPGGDRRLNVAITRARQKLILVASIRGSDLQPEGKNPTVRKLQEYLNYAERGGFKVEERAKGSLDSQELFSYDVVEDVYFALRERGYRVFRSIGHSNFPIDLAVVNDKNPAEYLLGIECDGKTYQTYSTARDRDRLRCEVLENLNWRIYRIWSKEWFHNKESQIEQLIAHLHDLGKP